MKTKFAAIFSIICAICISQDALAQGNTWAGSFIEISGGTAIPMGNFAASDYYNNTSGFAQTGSHYAVSGAWYITPNIGIGGMFSSSSFGVDANSIAKGYLVDFDCDSASTTARNYTSLSFLGGIYFALPLNNLTIEGRILGGITNTTSPDIITYAVNQADAMDPKSVSNFIQTSGTGNSLGLDAGFGVRYSLKHHLSLSLRGDYFYSKPNLSFDNIGRTDAVGREISSYKQAICGISVTLGIGYMF